MKFLIKTTENTEYVKQVAKEVSDIYKTEYKLDIKFDVEDIVLDLKNELLYEVENNWSFLKLEKTKSIKWAVVFAFHKPNYDGTCLFVDSNKSLQKSDLRGQYFNSNGIGLIEIYSSPERYIKKNTRNNETYYDDQKRKTNLKRDTYVLFHEIAHHIERLVGMDGLHKAELKDLQKSYIETCIVLLKKKHKPLKDWDTKVSQNYGNVDWKLYPKTGKHWGVDHAVPIGTPIYAPRNGFVHSIENSKDLGLHCLFSYDENGKYYTVLFAHLKLVEGDSIGNVRAGKKIAETGNTGKSTAPHLHTELWKGLIVDRSKIANMTLDPMKYL